MNAIDPSPILLPAAQHTHHINGITSYIRAIHPPQRRALASFITIQIRKHRARVVVAVFLTSEGDSLYCTGRSPTRADVEVVGNRLEIRVVQFVSLHAILCATCPFVE